MLDQRLDKSAAGALAAGRRQHRDPEHENAGSMGLLHSRVTHHAGVLLEHSQRRGAGALDRRSETPGTSREVDRRLGRDRPLRGDRGHHPRDRLGVLAAGLPDLGHGAECGGSTADGVSLVE